MILLALTLRVFPPAEVAVWYLFTSILALQVVASAGLDATFVRLLAWTLGGATDLSRPPSFATTEAVADARQPHLPTLAAAITVIHRSYLAIGVLIAAFSVCLGSLAMARPLTQLTDPSAGWHAWIVLAGLSPIVASASRYPVILQGLDRIAELRRWEAVSVLLSSTLSAVCLLAGGGMLSLVLTRQGVALSFVALCGWLSRRSPILVRLPPPSPADITAVWRAAWPSVWRSSLGMGMLAGVTELSGVVLAQLATGPTLAPYLVAQRLIYGLRSFAAAPFDSKIPLLARLRSQGHLDQLVTTARRGMRLSLWILGLGVALAGLSGNALFDLISSNIRFPPPTLWCLFSWAFFVERYGAMHLQLFSTSNRIYWHITNGVSGTIAIVTAVIAYPSMGVAAFPLGLLAGQLGFYAWFSARLSYRAHQLDPWHFESTVALPATLPLLAYTLIVLLG